MNDTENAAGQLKGECGFAGRNEIKILLLSRYGRLGSSSRLRSFQYLDFLRKAGCDVVVSPLLSDDYVERLYSGRRPNLGEVMRSYLRRIGALLDAGRYDLIWIEREAFPWFPYFVERVILPRHVPYVLDFDDAVFHRYDMHSWAILRAALGTKIDRLMSDASAVVVGNEYIRDRAQSARARHIEVLPTVVDLAKYEPCDATVRNCPVIGWIGTPQTQSFLDVASPALVELRRRHDFKVLLIGADRRALPAMDCETIAWSEDTEAQSLYKLDIGIMPLPDTSFARGKCGYKLIQYMACGLPVVASPVGMNSKLVRQGQNGYLAKVTEEWVTAMDALLSNRTLRLEMGAKGRSLVAEQYSLEAAGPLLVRILKDACSH